MFELFEPDSQFGSVGAGKSNKGRASVSQSSNITLSQQRQRCFCFATRAVPMIKKEPSVKHFVLSHVLLRPLRYLDEASLETMPSSW